MLLSRRQEEEQVKLTITTYQNMLPSNFEPTPYSVIFGRGKKCTNAVGNRRLKVIASLFLARYAKAHNDKEMKSKIVSEIRSMIEAACPVGAFVRLQEGTTGGDRRWIKVDDTMVRDKIGQVLRDCLHTKYRSSVKNKVVKRRSRREAAKMESSFASTAVPCNEWNDLLYGSTGFAEKLFENYQ